MRVGSIVYATDQGLGILAKQFYDNGLIDKVLVKSHPTRKCHHEWYKDGIFIGGLNESVLREFVKSIDIMLFFETPFWSKLVELCTECNVKTVMVPMYEWSLEKPLYQFDTYLCPSLLDLHYMKIYWKAKVMRVPVDPTTWKQRHRALRFLHNAGNGSVLGRPGTHELIQSLRYIKSPIDITFRCQNQAYYNSLGYEAYKSRYLQDSKVRVRWEIGTKDYNTLFDDYDVFVAPEKFNGLSLPLQEARAAGLHIITTNRFPSNFWLKENTTPDNPTSFINMLNEEEVRVGREYNKIKSAIVLPSEIAHMIDSIYDKDISAYSSSGKEWAEANSWKALREEWYNAIRS